MIPVRPLVVVLMAQHFLLSAGARSLSAAKIMRMSDDGVENDHPSTTVDTSTKLMRERKRHGNEEHAMRVYGRGNRQAVATPAEQTVQHTP